MRGCQVFERSQLVVPALLGPHGVHVACAFRQLCGCGHRFAEALVTGRFLVAICHIDLAANSHDPDHERHLRGIEFLAHILDEMGQQLTVNVVALFRIVVRVNTLDVAEHVFDVGHHLAVFDTGLGVDFGLVLFDGFPLRPGEFNLPFIELLGAGARRAEIGGQVAAAPGRLDQQDRVAHALFQREAEGEFRADLRSFHRRTETSGQLAFQQ